MKKVMLSAIVAPLLLGSFATSASADGINILSNLKAKGEIRPRYETVNVDGSKLSDAQAYTVRTKLSVSGDLLDVEGLSANVGVISVNNFGSDKYNDGSATGNTLYEKVVDPQKAILANAEINYKTGATLLHAGRGQVNLDNQRFIGTVGWRQLERSYDSVFVANNSIQNLSVLAAWVYGYQGVGAGATADTNTVLLHAVYKVNNMLNITAYDYMISNVHDTIGVALTGKADVSGIKLNYRAEYATQNDASMDIHNLNDTNGTVGIPGTKGQADADYYNLDLGANMNGILAGVNYEFLSGANASGTETAFSTPLATGHKFNGWADKFLATPTGGLEDFNVRLGYKAKGFGKLLAVYHNFTADVAMTAGTGTSDDLGSEFDALYANAIPGVNNLSGLIKAAWYSNGKVTNYTKDVTKVWAQLDYKFSM